MEAGTASALENIARAFDGLPDIPAGLTQEGALSELLQNSSVYSDARADVRPYSKELVSWPPEGSVPCPLIQGLSDADCKWFTNWQSHMLRNDSQKDRFESNSTQPPPKPHKDKSLFSSPRLYGEFLVRLRKANMLRWRTCKPGEDGVLGIFFVTKKDGTLILIFDTRLSVTYTPLTLHADDDAHD